MTMIKAEILLARVLAQLPKMHADAAPPGRQADDEDPQWASYGGVAGGNRHSPLTQITPANVAQLQIAWTYRTGELGTGFTSAGKLAFEATPILAEGSRSGSTVTISVTGGSATGTITCADDEFVNGEYSTAGGDAGEFRGSVAACTATAETGTIASLVINAPGLLPGNGRLAFDWSLTYVTALDADGNYVAAPELTWTFPAADQFLRTNGETTQRGQRWVIAQAPLPPAQGTGDPPELVTRTFTVASVNNPGVTATGTVVVYWYW